MMIPHPLLGLRDASEFVVLGDASLINRPTKNSETPESESEQQTAIAAFHEYVYLRDNPAGEHRELWFHEQGDRSWLVVTRNTLTHDIVRVELAREVARREGRSR